MNAINIVGNYNREPEIGQDDYLLYQLSAINLNHLASLLEDSFQSSSSMAVNIGEGHLIFQAVSDGFAASITDDGVVLVEASNRSLKDLAIKLRQMAELEPDPDHLIHIHFDSYFTHTPNGLSDIVIERLEK